MVVVINATRIKKKNSLRASGHYEPTYYKAIQLIQETQGEKGAEVFA